MSETRADTPARPITGIDHATIGVRDLAAARETYTRLGFTVSPRGRHVGWGTANYTIMFERDYIALLAIVDPDQFVNYVDDVLEYGEGIANIAFRTEDAHGLHAWLGTIGVIAEPPHALQRIIETEDEQTLEFALLDLPPRWTPGLHSVVFHHLTPNQLRPADWLSHPNGARAIAEVTVVMDELDGVIAAYRHLFGADAVSGDERRGSVTVKTGNGELWFVTPKAFPERHYDRQVAAGAPLPWLAALTLEVRDPHASSLFLSGQQLAFETESDGTIIVAPEDACGVLLEFAAAR